VSRALLVSCLLLLSCSGGGGAADAASAQDAGNTYFEFCMAYGTRMQCGLSCPTTGLGTRDACIAVVHDRCVNDVRAFQVRAAAGLVRFTEEEGAGCLEDIDAYLGLVEPYFCDGGSPPAEVIRSVYGTTCVDGRSQFSYPWDRCVTALNGNIPPGGACSSNQDCQQEGANGQSTCETGGDGGCGTCTDGLRAEGEPCVVEYDGGSYGIPCAVPLVCDYYGDKTCKPERRQGESCTLSGGACSYGCGTICANAGDGGYTCQLPPGEGGSCEYSYWCAPGLACVAIPVDGGYTFPCVPYAREGDACSEGQRGQEGEPFGAHSSGQHPVCAAGFICDVVGMSSDGICRAPLHDVMTGEPCGELHGCADPADLCQFPPDGMGSDTCRPAPGLDDVCNGDGQCVAGLYCNFPEGFGSPGHCAPFLNVGGACPDQRGCQPELTCFHNVCTRAADAYEAPLICQ